MDQDWTKNDLRRVCGIPENLVNSFMFHKVMNKSSKALSSHFLSILLPNLPTSTFKSLWFYHIFQTDLNFVKHFKQGFLYTIYIPNLVSNWVSQICLKKFTIFGASQFPNVFRHVWPGTFQGPRTPQPTLSWETGLEQQLLLWLGGGYSNIFVECSPPKIGVSWSNLTPYFSHSWGGLKFKKFNHQRGELLQGFQTIRGGSGGPMRWMEVDDVTSAEVRSLNWWFLVWGV